MLKRGQIFVGLLLIAISPLKAQVAIDVTKINCQQFATCKVANPDRIAIWLNGYFHGKRGDLSVDTQELWRVPGRRQGSRFLHHLDAEIER